MEATTVTDLLVRNDHYAKNDYTPRPYFSELSSLGLSPPSMFVVTCADPRITPEQFLGLQPGEAVVFRTAGGRVGPVMKDILTIDSFVGHGTITQCFIIHHTDCGASHFTDKSIKADMISRHPERSDDIKAWDIGAFEDRSISESVKDDIMILKSESMISNSLKDGIVGFVFDIKTGCLQAV